MSASNSTPISSEPIKVWDLFVRIFHWSLALCVLLNFFVFEEGESFHEYSGYLACGLVFLRAIWDSSEQLMPDFQISGQLVKSWVTSFKLWWMVKSKFISATVLWEP